MKNINADFKSLSRALEFDQILSDIANYAVIEENKKKILSLHPLNNLEDIIARHTAVQAVSYKQLTLQTTPYE